MLTAGTALDAGGLGTDGPVLRPEPVTDPRGFRAFSVVPRPPEPRRWGWVDPREAGALAAAFALDYLSWDETDPGRRGRVMAGYLPGWADDLERIGWSGRGRQRADFAVPGPVHTERIARATVEVRVRVTPYRARPASRPPPSSGVPGGDTPSGRGAATPAPPGCDATAETQAGADATEPAGPGYDATPSGCEATAPAPFARGWQSLASRWTWLIVPVVALDDGWLVVDIWEEALA